MYKLLIINP
nr:RecName: Full=Butyrate kinase; Short=BK; AltName: Full=CP 38 [Clostridium pasteurianum]